MGQAGVVGQRAGHRHDKRIDAGAVGAQRQPRLRQRLPALGQARQQRARLFPGAAPQQHVGPRHVMRAQQVAMRGQHRVLVFDRHLQRVPGQHQPRLRIGHAPLGAQGPCQRQRAGAGARAGVTGEKPQNLPRRGIVKPVLGAAADQAQPGPVAMRVEEIQRLGQRARAGAQALPFDQRHGLRPGPDGQRGGVVPVAGARRRQRAGQRARPLLRRAGGRAKGNNPGKNQ